MSDTDVSVVIPVRGDARGLEVVLTGLARQTYRRFEVLVVENGSRSEAVAACATRAGARLLRERVANRAAARNAGAAAASSALLAFTDADCTPRVDWLEALVGCLARAPLVAGPVVLEVGEPPNRYERLEQLWRFDQERNVRESGWAASANLGMTRVAFSAVGGFDPAYRLIGEDVDLCVRAAALGFRIGFCREAAVAHPAERSLAPILRRAFRHGWSSQQHERRLPQAVGWRYWRHPKPSVAGDWALRRFGIADPCAHRDLLAVARAEYAARVAGSAWAALRRVR